MNYREAFERARGFILRNARPVDRARWAYHFENGSAEDVLAALAAYQNADGGFGHALEADCWNPNSSPIQTWAATEILHELTPTTDREHPIVRGIVRYLESGAEFDGRTWANAVRTNDDHPHAPWWQYGSESASHASYNPTACLAAFLARFSKGPSTANLLAARVAVEALGAFLDGEPLQDMHVAACYLRMFEYGVCSNDAAFREKLAVCVSALITRETARWETGYVCRPSNFGIAPGSAFYPGNEGIAEYECEFIARTQLPDGSWPVNWSWADYPEEWAISKNWWKADIAIKNMRHLKAMGKLPE